MQGFLLIDKPDGMTSHDVVYRVRQATVEKRVGHAGTLDPFATGLLIVGVSRSATREMQKLVGLDKTYEATFILGASSETDDPEGDIIPKPLKKTSESDISEAIKQFVGEIEQLPPTYSAIKIGGKKMYEAAREGKPLKAKPRNVRIDDITLNSFDHDGDLVRVNVTIMCSSGTYIRSIARDLGRALGGGGYVSQLRRTHIGPFSIEESVDLETIKTQAEQHLIPVETLLGRL